MLTNITINRSYSIGSTSQLRSIVMMYDINNNDRNWIHILNDLMDFIDWNEFIEMDDIRWICALHEFVL